ncbi:single-stranded-DNA-specific exonuclease RecJ [Fictibacillus aquaticus]|uniref:Single-stranded-DNA-specific exonuclease RecJ n=1 Tax=Fictibacillus aquaticus TaxID=2021314 RepID=A0A235FA36_9BACL|nr:single-stranded-DNA-specific exonuclease RecJ [Fictibacillus aquaticus]OYD58039.1 single-stranded-DNA-specific exonuclease RecJ [Fictibacillus aquaticus]
MLQPKTRWITSHAPKDKIDALASSMNLPEAVAQLLISRGMETEAAVEKFLKGGVDDFHNPFLMDGMKESVDRIISAIENNEKILVFGDYDADGVSSTSVMWYTLKELGADFDYYIPNRFTEGYGPNEPALRKAKEDGFSLVITVDTGISAVDQAAAAREMGLDFIITDHHEAPPVLPDAYSIINPKKPGCSYPFKGLAGVGVALKVSQALLGRVPVHLFDIGCIGTIADLVPLVDENRLIAREGIKALSRTNKKGLIELLKVCNIKDKELTAEHIGFAVGPRVNAAGRLDSADPAVELFITDDSETGERLAKQIDSINKERQAIVNEITEEAVKIVEEEFPPAEQSVLVIAKEGWNAGVIGIVASRLVEKYYRPTIVLSIDHEKGTAKGSARSIAGFDMFENLSLSRDILPHFGGHPMAAGMTLSLHDVDELRNRLNKQAEEQLSPEDFQPITAVDLELELSDISLETVELMERLAPFGTGNPAPKVCLRNVPVREMKKIGSQSNHLKMQVGDSPSKLLDCIGFFKGAVIDEIAPYSLVSFVGELNVNEWNGFRKPQLMVQDIAVTDWQLFDYRGLRDIASRLADLPEKRTVYVRFSQTALIKHVQEKPFVFEAEENQLPPKGLLEGKYAVFLDVPSSLAHFKEWLEEAGQPDRIYAVFHHESDHFFSTIPSRDQFKWYYAFLMKKGLFHIDKQGEELARWKGWSKETVDFMSKVFFELDFVTIENGVITVKHQPVKKDLESSELYRRKLNFAELESGLVYSSYQQLKQWFTDIKQHEKIVF